MEKDELKLISEIIIMIMILAISIPICVNASNKYNKETEKLQCLNKVSLELKNKDGEKKMVIRNYSDKESINVNVILKITKFLNKYQIEIEGKKIDLSNLEYSEDEENYYYNLGKYEINKKKEIKFNLSSVGDNEHDEIITYSFLTEEYNC